MTAADKDLERAVLGGFLALGDQAHDTLGLSERNFGDPRHAIVWDGIRELIETGDPVDAITVIDRLGASDVDRIGGRAYVHDLASVVPVSNLRHYARLLRRHTGRRDLEHRALRVLEMARDGGDIAELAAELADAVEATSEDVDWADQADVLTQVISIMESGGANGLPTGFGGIDSAMGGMDEGAVHIVAGRPGMGKTAFALAVARHVAGLGRGSVLVVSLEMSTVALGQRLLASEAGVALQRVRSAKLSDADRNRMMEAGVRLRGLDLLICRRSVVSPAELRRMVKAEQSKRPVAMVVVDYLQLLRGKGASTYERATSISRELKQAAVACGVPMMVLSQLNRGVEQRQDKRPTMSDLRDSGAIEEDAETVTLLYRPGFYDLSADQRDAEAILGKNRNGQQGSIPLLWYGATTTYMEAKK